MRPLLNFISLISNMYQYENIKVEVSSEGIAHVQINRPNSLNALLPQYVAFYTILFK